MKKIRFLRERALDFANFLCFIKVCDRFFCDKNRHKPRWNRVILDSADDFLWEKWRKNMICYGSTRFVVDLATGLWIMRKGLKGAKGWDFC